jgi:predicted nucleotidyltransferase
MRKADNVSPDRISEMLSSLKTEAKQRFKAEIKGFFGSYERGEEIKE